MYFRSDVKDDPVCRGLTFDPQAQRYIWPEPVSNPAITCPDAFGWTQFLDAIRDEFWSNWAFDTFTWPQQPLAFCPEGGENCCNPNSSTNPGYDDPTNPALHCPFFPGDHGGLSVIPAGDRPHEVTPAIHGIIAQTDPARKLREEEAEIVYRNKAFLDYVFQNNLYNQEGLAERFNRTVATVATNAPFRATGLEIRFPADAVMFKTDWIHQDFMLELGLAPATSSRGCITWWRSPAPRKPFRTGTGTPSSMSAISAAATISAATTPSASTSRRPTGFLPTTSRR
jgi:hypothetical protein